ncbi:MAG: M48 family metalloprotease, partial [Myxococcota bacterium]
HEFGHFAQRAMAVGRWVYVGQAIAARIIGKRDALDDALMTLSHIDLRVAWIGWVLRFLAWAIRSVTDSIFRVVVLAERALSREMEFQADRVAVSLAGSDALIHALFKLRSADAAWEQAESGAARALGQSKRVPDLFELQTHARVQLRRIFGDDEFGDAPPVPGSNPAAHRVFTPALAQPPVMWSTHPPSHLREESAKALYVEGSEDPRSAWCLFAQPEQRRLTMTTHILGLWGGPEDAVDVSGEQALALAEDRFDKAFLESRYHGLYLGRATTRHASTLDALYGDVPSSSEELLAKLRNAYPESLGDIVSRARALAKELREVKALALGVAKAPGGVTQHRGRVLRRKELRMLVDEVQSEREAAEAELSTIDRELRAMHDEAAKMLGNGWDALLYAQAALLHFAEHLEANLDDAMGHLGNVVDVVTADGRVSESEALRLVQSGTDVSLALQRVWDSRKTVQIGPAVAAAMDVASWQAAFEDEEYGLPLPSRENLEGWMGAVDSWFNAYSGLMGSLSTATLEVLLETEAHVRRCVLEGRDPGPAPAAPTLAPDYHAFVRGAERERQTKLGLWDRFMTAEGVGPGLARFGVSAAVVGGVVFSGSALSNASVVAHNGLQHDVVISLGPETQNVPAFGRAEFDVDPSEPVTIETHTREGALVESFVQEIDNPFGDYVYSVGGAVPLYVWTAVYGDIHEPAPRMLGAVRWLEPDADHLFEEPPRTVSTRNDQATTRDVLTALDATTIDELVIAYGNVDEGDRTRVALLHGRWDGPVLSSMWLSVAHEDEPGAAEEVLSARLQDDAGNVLFERLAQDFAEPGPARDAVCRRHREARTAKPDDGDAAYLALRCEDDRAKRHALALEASDAFPSNAWLRSSAAYARFAMGEHQVAAAQLQEAMAQLPSLASQWAVDVARMRRMGATMEGAVDLDDLSNASLMLSFLLQREQGNKDAGDGQAFSLLANGALDSAVAAAAAEGRRREVVRLAATSVGATAALLEAAAEIEEFDNPGLGEVVAAYVVAMRAGRDPSAVRARLDELWSDSDQDVLERICDPTALAADPAGVSAMLATLPPNLRGHGTVLALGLLGAAAPNTWRADARRLLFLGERPFLGHPGSE